MDKILGLDIGHTYSSISANISNKPSIIPNNEGYNITPSVISYNKDNILLIGEHAKIQYLINPNKTYTLLNSKDLFVEQTLIHKLIHDANTRLNTDSKDIIISLPSDYSIDKINNIKHICKQNNINIIHFISKINAIALQYSLNHNNELIMIVHLDETYYEVSILEIDTDHIEELGYYRSNLKGLDIDKIIMKHLIDSFKEQYNKDLSQDKLALPRIYDAAIKAKKELYTSLTSHILIPYIKTDEYGPLNLDVELTRKQLNQLIRPVLEQLEQPLYHALNDARLLPSELDKILIIGDNTRLTSIQDKIKEITNHIPSLAMNQYEYYSLGILESLNKKIINKKD